MSELEALQARIAALTAELHRLEKVKTPRGSKNPRSPLYVVDYSRLTKVNRGYVAPEILDMYKEVQHA